MVSVKRIPTAMLADADAVARFRREAVVLAGLDHPRIVGAYDFQIGPRGAVLIMEYVPGRSLRDVLDQAPMDPLLSVRDPRRRRRGAGRGRTPRHRAPGREAGQRLPGS
ncbi:MAG: protein kinase [Geodermatophilaceae bacterium]|nr:protein kinase [Geodermatophilaceae bacterium]